MPAISLRLPGHRRLQQRRLFLLLVPIAFVIGSYLRVRKQTWHLSHNGGRGVVLDQHAGRLLQDLLGSMPPVQHPEPDSGSDTAGGEDGQQSGSRLIAEPGMSGTSLAAGLRSATERSKYMELGVGGQSRDSYANVRQDVKTQQRYSSSSEAASENAGLSNIDAATCLKREVKSLKHAPFSVADFLNARPAR